MVPASPRRPGWREEPRRGIQKRMRNWINSFRRAHTAMKGLREDPDRTDLVNEIVEALDGGRRRRFQRRIWGSAEAKRLLGERPCFDAEHIDLAELAGLPEGSFGHTAANWMRSEDFQPGLEGPEVTGEDDRAYVARRIANVHDLWHVLSGYNRDPMGELGVLAFSLGQFRSNGFAFILGNILWRSSVDHWRAERRPVSPLFHYLLRAYRAGRRAERLIPLILEERFPQPLDQVRRDLGIDPLTTPFTAEGMRPIGVPVTPPA